MKKRWMGTEPSKCDICVKENLEEFYDARTKMGQWGILCKKCFNAFGIGLGLGKGQHYVKEGQVFVKKDG